MTVYLAFNSEGELPVLSGYSPFSCALIANKATSLETKSEVCEKLAKSGCRYFVTWGVDCSNWHDVMDDVWLGLQFSGVLSEEAFIMTTWHENETFEDMLFFAKNCTAEGYNGLQISNLIVLDFGRMPRCDEVLNLLGSV